MVNVRIRSLQDHAMRSSMERKNAIGNVDYLFLEICEPTG